MLQCKCNIPIGNSEVRYHKKSVKVYNIWYKTLFLKIRSSGISRCVKR